MWFMAVLPHPLDDSPESILNQFMESVMLLRHTNHRHCFSLLGVLHKEAGAPMFLFPKTLYGSLKHLLNDVRDGAGNSVLKQVGSEIVCIL